VINQIIDKNEFDENIVKLNSEKKHLLDLSETDIAN
jgi:hypothetical protein